MFHGGTNFGFMNGANILGYNGLEFSPSYVPDVTREEFHLIGLHSSLLIHNEF